MGQVLHENARTTEAIRREIRDSKKSIGKAAKRFNVNPKTILKWRKREDTKDLPMEPKKIKSTVLSETEEEAIVAFRQLTPYRYQYVLNPLLSQENFFYFLSLVVSYPLQSYLLLLQHLIININTF
ncbi:hypothetical protein HCUR_01368 [Holospora curviuscula]|uniref:Transposase n=2 Tax=Holospora curviuscula TaxID=1082868 RepID=A0A2S5R7B2_9PROT|nr:hypothetical protein HCUR_01368 [Holospora curviuscula]